jgi:O-antigen/teichoic acid export membrane protein
LIVAPAHADAAARRWLVDWLVSGGSTIAGQALGVLTAILLRMALGPTQMGLWQGLRTLLGYANYANLGASKAAARELSIARGHGHAEAAQPGLNVAFTVNTLSSAAYAGVLLLAAAWRWARGEPFAADAWCLGLAAIALLAVVQRHVTFQVTLLRCQQAVAAAARVSLLEAVLTVTLTVALAGMWNLPGLYLGTLLVLAGSWWLLRRQGLPRLCWSFDTRAAWRLIVTGGPILAAGAVAALLSSIDKLVLLAWSGDGATRLGHYSVALMVAAQITGLGTALANVAWPRFGATLGRTGSRSQTVQLALRVLELQAAVLAPLTLGAMLLAPPVLGWLLPEYRPGLPALYWLLPGALAAALAQPAGQCVVALDGGRRALAAAVAGLLLAAAAVLVALAFSGSLSALATAMTAGNLAYLACVLGALFRRDVRPQSVLRCVATLLAALLPPLALAALTAPWR